jgi:hypothetical protein
VDNPETSLFIQSLREDVSSQDDVSMRNFDLQQANSLIPYLDRTFTSVRAWTQQAQDLTAALMEQGDCSPVGAEIEDLFSPLGRLRLDRERLVENIRRALVPVGDLGIQVKSLEGLVDFRALRSGRLVYLCWKYGERTITHWHELDAGFSGRRVIGDSVFTPSYPS